MARTLRRILGLRTGDFGAALPFFALQAGVAAYWAVAASAGDALLLSFLRAHALPIRVIVPLTYLAVAAVAGALLALFDSLQKRLSRRLLVAATPLVLGASIAAARPLLALDAAWLRFALAVWLEVAALVSMTLAFSLVADRFGSRDAKRLYGFIGGGFCVGLAAGGSAVPWLARRVGAGGLLPIAAFILAANAAISGLTSRSAPAGLPEDEPSQPAPPLRALAADPYLLFVAGAVFLGGALFVLVDFQLKSLASGLPQDQIAAFFGRLYGLAGVGEALLQFALLRLLIRRAGVLNLQLVFPALMAAGAAATLRAPGLAAAAAVNLARMISAESVERPTRELLFLPLPRRVRARAQALIDGPVASCGQAAAAVGLLVFPLAVDQRALAGCALGAAALAFIPLLLMRTRYRRLLSTAVRARPLGAVDLARLAHEPGAREALEELLGSEDEHGARFARAVLERAQASPRPTPREPDELSRLDDPSLTSARRCAFAARLGRLGGEASGRALWSALERADSALTAAAARAALELQRRDAWEGPPPAELNRRRALEADALSLLARAHREARDDVFRAAVIEDFARVRLDAILSLHALNGGPAALDSVRLDLWSRDPASRSAALELAEELLPARAVAALAAWNEEPDAAAAPARARTREALAVLDPALGRVLDEGSVAARTRRLRALPLLQGLETPYLLQLLEASRELARAPGELLLREGDSGEALLLIEDGSIAVRSAGRQIAALGPGECLGELSVIDGRPRSADAVCLAPARLIAIEREAFREVAFGRPAVGLSLARVLERRLRAAFPPAAPEANAGARAVPEMSDPGARRKLLTAAALRKTPLLAALPEAVLAAVAELARPVPVFENELLFGQGDPGDALYVIASGRVRVESRGEALAVLGPGDVFGELALLSGLPRAAGVRVVADGLLFAIGASSFERLLRDEPTALWSLLETMAGRLRAAISPACDPPR